MTQVERSKALGTASRAGERRACRKTRDRLAKSSSRALGRAYTWEALGSRDCCMVTLIPHSSSHDCTLMSMNFCTAAERSSEVPPMK